MDNNINEQGYNNSRYGGQGVPPVKPNNYLILSIITTVCCCLPLGIVAIIKSTQVDSHYNTGQYQAAQQAADDAKKWSIIGMVIGGIGVVIYVAICLIYGVAIFSQVS